jgi:hypothetical protein
MTQPFTGGCACGAVRYAVTGAPIDMNHCQCRECQRASGTGHGSHLTFAGAGVAITGEPSRWVATGEMGTRKSKAFCPTCGAQVFMTFPDMPDVFVAFAASLDDPSRFQPQHILWASSAQAWDRLDPSLPSFAKMPTG